MDGMEEQIKYAWQQSVIDAFVSNADELASKINLAERVISARLKDPDELDLNERIALKDALRALQVLIFETHSRLGDPGRPQKPNGSDQKKEDSA
jgi:hypothetical protein